MKKWIWSLFLFCALFFSGAACAQNPEDLAIEDAPITDERGAVQKEAPRAPAHHDHIHGHATEHGVHPHKVQPAPADNYSGEDLDFSTPSPVEYVQIWKSFSGTNNGFMRMALLAGVLVALMCSYLGVFVVLKRIVFVSVALAEMSSAGIALGMLTGFSPILGAAALTLLGVTVFAIQWSPRRIPRESFIGVLYAIAAAGGILLIAKSAQGEGHMLTLLQGDILTISPPEVWEMAAVFVLIAIVHALFRKEFILVSFDRDQAATLGYRAAWWDFLLFLTIGIVIAFSIRAAGVLLTTSMLVLPATTALLLTRNLRATWICAALVAILPVPLGLHLSLLSRDFPSSALIAALLFLLMLPPLLYSLRRSA